MAWSTVVLSTVATLSKWEVDDVTAFNVDTFVTDKIAKGKERIGDYLSVVYSDLDLLTNADTVLVSASDFIVLAFMYYDKSNGIPDTPYHYKYLHYIEQYEKEIAMAVKRLTTSDDSKPKFFSGNVSLLR